MQQRLQKVMMLRGALKAMEDEIARELDGRAIEAWPYKACVKRGRLHIE